jgi:peptide chain release factor subunit 1
VLTREEIRSLADLDPAARPVISFYMNINRKQVGEENYSRTLRQLIRDAEDVLPSYDEEYAKDLQKDLDRIERVATDERVAGSHSLAIIASYGAGIWKQYHLPDVSETSLVISDSPRLRPLLQNLDQMYRYCVLLVNKEKGRIFMVSAGEITDYSEIFDQIPPKHDQGGWSQSRFQRHHDDHVMHHVKRAADIAFDIFQREGFDRLIIGGTEEAVQMLPESLHSYLKERLVGQISLDVDATADVVLAETSSLNRSLKDDSERQLVTALKDTLGAGGPAAAGIEPVLRTLERGQVMNLIVANGVTSTGVRCDDSGVLTVEPEKTCREYGAKGGQPISDIIEQMIIQAVKQDAKIEFVHGEDMRKELEQLGNVGALLRFSVPT